MTEKTTKKYILDASVIIKWFNRENEKYLEKALDILNLLKKKKIKITVPELTISEFFNALFKGKKLQLKELYLAHKTFFQLPFKIESLTKSSSKLAIKIATKYNLTYYDSVYAALSKKNNSKLITANPKCFKKIKEKYIINLQDF